MSVLFPEIKSPTHISIELTTACNQKCRHCYNFWRHKDTVDQSIDKEKADRIIDQIIENGVFHVVLTGGECMLNSNILLHFMERLSAAGISLSMNSNLLNATEERMKAYADLGLPHTLTSLNCHIPEINDMMVSRKGAFDRIVTGINHAINAGIRVSVNMIVTQRNKEHVYDTGRFISDLGVTNFFTTRMVPPHLDDSNLEQELQIAPEDQKRLILDEAIRVHEDTGINIGSLIQYPVCFLQDVEKYRFYIGRGCRAGRELLTINADGKTQACVHEQVGYGNILKDGLKECWKNMSMWRNGSLIPPTCSKCEWLVDCEGACRVYTDDLKSMDYLACDPSRLPSRANFISPLKEIASQKVLFVPDRVRWRQEDGFQLVNVRGATTYEISNYIAEYLKKHQAKQTSFTAEDFPGSLEEVANLLDKWVVETTDTSTQEPSASVKSVSLVSSE